ncbi:MAG: type II toxin-antitoxin system HipA family toxin [Phaeodactylibacter sp.]|nr:type II toxin-antitoxin system HipA family toxin [Phaeodactylibacter sp.]
MKEIIVYADWQELPSIIKMGVLRAEQVRGEEVFSFEYDEQWLQSGFAQVLDPDLRLFTGPQYITDEKPNFGIFLDSSPDRWGRTLMKRREAFQAREEKRKERRLFESDYLLGVNDVSRLGALRFKLSREGPFLDDDTTFPTPPFSSIRELEHASLRIEDDDFFEDQQASKWLRLLMAPGSSLGGARPKASVLSPEGHLWIAKFPSKNDDKDQGAWELIVNKLAEEAEINMAQGMAKKFSQKNHTYLTKRFDRSDKGERIHFASAMTLLGYKDGINHQDGASYLELVEVLERYGAQPEEDLLELWKRIVFSICVSNTDDHLRNHGFLLTNRGWRLSPAYDINPNEQGVGLSLNIDENDNALDLDLAKSVAEYFRVNLTRAENFIRSTKKIVNAWRNKADRLGISKVEQEMMKSAFE